MQTDPDPFMKKESPLDGKPSFYLFYQAILNRQFFYSDVSQITDDRSKMQMRQESDGKLIYFCNIQRATFQCINHSR